MAKYPAFIQFVSPRDKPLMVEMQEMVKTLSKTVENEVKATSKLESAVKDYSTAVDAGIGATAASKTKPPDIGQNTSGYMSYESYINWNKGLDALSFLADTIKGVLGTIGSFAGAAVQYETSLTNISNRMIDPLGQMNSMYKQGGLMGITKSLNSDDGTMWQGMNLQDVTGVAESYYRYGKFRNDTIGGATSDITELSKVAGIGHRIRGLEKADAVETMMKYNVTGVELNSLRRFSEELGSMAKIGSMAAAEVLAIDKAIRRVAIAANLSSEAIISYGTEYMKVAGLISLVGGNPVELTGKMDQWATGSRQGALNALILNYDITNPEGNLVKTREAATKTQSLLSGIDPRLRPLMFNAVAQTQGLGGFDYKNLEELKRTGDVKADDLLKKIVENTGKGYVSSSDKIASIMSRVNMSIIRIGQMFADKIIDLSKYLEPMLQKMEDFSKWAAEHPKSILGIIVAITSLKTGLLTALGGIAWSLAGGMNGAIGTAVKTAFGMNAGNVISATSFGGGAWGVSAAGGLGAAAVAVTLVGASLAFGLLFGSWLNTYLGRTGAYDNRDKNIDFAQITAERKTGYAKTFTDEDWNKITGEKTGAPRNAPDIIKELEQILANNSTASDNLESRFLSNPWESAQTYKDLMVNRENTWFHTGIGKSKGQSNFIDPKSPLGERIAKAEANTNKVIYNTKYISDESMGGQGALSANANERDNYIAIIKELGFNISSGMEDPNKHNPGSKHPFKAAFDVGVQGKSAAEINKLLAVGNDLSSNFQGWLEVGTEGEKAKLLKENDALNRFKISVAAKGSKFDGNHAHFELKNLAGIGAEDFRSPENQSYKEQKNFIERIRDRETIQTKALIARNGKISLADGAIKVPKDRSLTPVRKEDVLKSVAGNPVSEPKAGAAVQSVVPPGEAAVTPGVTTRVSLASSPAQDATDAATIAKQGTRVFDEALYSIVKDIFNHLTTSKKNNPSATSTSRSERLKSKTAAFART